MPKLDHLADDPETYGDDAGKWIVVSDDGQSELTGPMREADARAFLGLLEAVGNTLEDFGANGPFSITLPVRLGELRTAYQAATGGNPHHIVTPLGPPVVVQVGDACAEIDTLRARERELVRWLAQALRQWAMYAKITDLRELEDDNSPEGDMYRTARDLLNRVKG